MSQVIQEYSLIEQAAALTKISLSAKAMCDAVLLKAFPPGEAVKVGSPIGIVTGPSDIIGQVNVRFENGNTWAKDPAILTVIPWSKVPAYYKKYLGKVRKAYRKVRVKP